MDIETVKKQFQDVIDPILGAIGYNKKPRRFFSIDFGEAALKIAYVESNAGKSKLLNYDLKKLSKEEAKEETVEFINSFISSNSISEKEVYLTISNADSIAIKPLMLPVVPKQEILGAAKWQLKEEVAFDLENALIDWQVVKEYIDEDGAKKNQITFILVEKEILDRYLSIVRSCNLQPIKISVAGFNYANIIKGQEREVSQIKAVLDIGFQESRLFVYNEGKLQFVRVLPFSSDRLTRSLTGVLISDKGKLQLSYEQAEEIKLNFGIPQDEAAMLKDDIRAIQIISLMRPLLEGLVRELKRSFDYFTSTFQEESISTLYIAGGGSGLKNLNGFLNNELNIDILALPLPDALEVPEALKEKQSIPVSQMSSCLAATLKGPEGIDLLPREVKAQKVEFIEKVSLRVVAVAVAAVFLFSLFVVKLQISDYKNRLKNAQVHLQTIDEIKLLNQKIIAKEQLLDKIQKDKVPVDGLLKLMTTLVPNNVILNEFIMNQERHTLVLSGAITEQVAAAETTLTIFMEKLEASSFFKEATLVSSSKTIDAQKFEIKCDLVH